MVDTGDHGRLTADEVAKLRKSNIAFWECYMQDKPNEEVLRKKQAQYDKKTANVKQARTTKPVPAVSSIKSDDGGTKSSRKTRLVTRAATAASRQATSTFTELVDPTAVDLLEEIAQSNPVLTKIRECGVKAKREDVYPTSTTLQAETYVYTYLKNFPENTFGKCSFLFHCVADSRCDSTLSLPLNRVTQLCRLPFAK